MDRMPEDIYVVRSAEDDPIHYAAVPTLVEAQQIIKRLEELAEGAGHYDMSFDYDEVPYFTSGSQALTAIGDEW
jgi:hypothetical protein